MGVKVSGGGGLWMSYVRVGVEVSRSGGQCGVEVTGVEVSWGGGQWGWRSMKVICQSGEGAQ